MNKRVMTLVMSLWIGAEALSAGVVYDGANNCLRVVDYPEAQPATLQTLLEADQQNGWGKVSHQPGTDTYTLDAAIWIGNRSGYSTFFKIGDRAHSKLTLVLKGSLWVRPAIRGIARSDGSPSVMNALIIGDPSDSAITPQILFDCAEPGEHGLYGGLRKGKVVENDCALQMYNATVAAAKSREPPCRWGRGDYRMPGEKKASFTMGCYVRSFQLVNCRFADFTGPLFYGADTVGWSNRERQFLSNAAKTIRGCIFKNGGIALASQQYLCGCVFRNVNTPVQDNGSLYVWAYASVFENNQYNWGLDGYGAYGLNLVDCRVFPQSKPMLMKKNALPQPRQGILEYPSVRLMKSLRVRVLDRKGKPVPMAVVEVRGNGTIKHPEGLTDVDGWTEADPRTKGMAVTVKQYTATDIPEAPAITEDFRYAISTSAGGKSASRIVSVKELEQPVILTIESIAK